MTKLQWSVTLIITLLSSAISASGQYSVAPNAHVIHSPSRSTELYIRMSPDAPPMEFTLSAFFAIPGTDSLGSFELQESEELSHRDATPHLRFSPRRFILESGAQQTVRITITSDSLPEGEYWARIMTSAKLLSDIGSDLETSMSASVGLDIRTVSGFLYRKGALRSDIGLESARAFFRNDSVFVDIELSKLGIAAWLGTLDVAISDQVDIVIHKSSITTNAYRAGRYRYLVANKPLEPGLYTASLTLKTLREDASIPLIPAPTVRKNTTFTIEKS
jgi:hypothetical protein